jgi:GDPmannose 4,6-dehydratase
MGNMNALRDWGHAKDYVEMQWLMLQQDKPEDFVIATGEQHSVREFISLAAKEIGMNIEWKGQDLHEIGIDTLTGKQIIEIDPRYFRPTEVETLLGDASKAKQKLGWVPKISFQELVKEMALSDLKLAEQQVLSKTHGYRYFDHYE